MNIKLFKSLVATTFLVSAGSAVIAGPTEVRQVQAMLNFIGYESGPADGVAGRRTNAAVEKFYRDRGQVFDGTIDGNEVDFIKLEAEAKGYATQELWSSDTINNSQSNLPLFVSNYYNNFPSGGNMRFREMYGGTNSWAAALADFDYDGDGIRDKVIAVVAEADNRSKQEYGESDREYGLRGRCDGECEFSTFSGVIFLKGQGNGEFRYVPGAIVENPDNMIEYGHQIETADFNGDGKLDIIVTDHGLDHWRDDFVGRTLKYFLSQPDGTWRESSATHMNGGRHWRNFNHGITVGDIDSDGDIDIVETSIARNNQAYLWCRINDGAGNMTPRACGGRGTGWGLAAEDFDGDGCIDVAQVGTGGERYHFTGINWGNCSGRFNGATTRINDHDGRKDDPNNWEGTVNVWSHDLDGDGDKDLIVSRIGTYYVGGAFQIVENLGNRKFEDRGIFVYNAPPETAAGVRSCHDNSEANPCNLTVDRLYFIDVNNDGIDDLVTTSGAAHVNGLVWINNGNYEFNQTSARDLRIAPAMHRRDD
jgi:hypothetical protein